MVALAKTQREMMAKKTTILLALFVLAMPTMAADPAGSDAPEFVFARLIYSSGFGGFRGGGGSWRTDYPEADYKFMYGIERLSGIRVKEDQNPVAIMDPELFTYPYLYAVEVGRMELSAQEATRLREYFLRGGFMHADDFWGLEQRRNFENQLRKIFPDRPIEEIPLTNEIFHTFYDVNTVMQIPNINNALSGGPTWEQASDIRPRILGIKDDDGRLMVVITYNSDLGDAWEWMDDPGYPEMYSGQSYRMGLNFIIYAMTH
jgi:hypothetical protein